MSRQSVPHQYDGSTQMLVDSNDRDDMVMTSVSTFLSLTAHCARCHNHKFDPIPQTDYYRLQAVFAGVDRADRAYDADSQTAHTRRELAAAQRSLDSRQAAVTAAIARLGGADLQAVDARLAELDRQLAALAKADGPPDSPTNGYHSGIMPTADAVKWVQVDLGETVPLDELRLMPARPTDFPDSPGFGFPQRFTVAISDDADFAAFDLLADHSRDDFANPGDKPVVISAAGELARYVRVTASRLWLRTNDYVFALAELQALSAGRNVAFGARVNALDSIEAGLWSTAHLVDGYDSRHRLAELPDADQIRRRRDQLEAEHKAALAERERLIDSRLDDATRRELDAVARESADVAQQRAALPPQQMVYAAAPAGNFTSAGAKPRTVYFLNRGSVKNPGEPMSPGALSCLPNLDSNFALADENDEGSRRAALARWITDPRNVLTRRSIVNRVWQYHFGRGIVDTPNDFGRMGSPPTHPELLDWLAVEFFERGESLKRLHRLILTSAVYRQSSRGQETGERIDAANRYLWRMNRRRLDAECVRDAVLAVTGMLDRRAGGPSDEQFYFKDDHSPVYDYERFNVDDPRSFRRSVYRFIVRSVPDSFMDCLDCADPSILTPKRNTTLTALQALAMLNDRFIVSQSGHFAERARRLASDPAGQIAAAYLLALGRRPTADESAALVDYAERFGLANACRVVLNSNEFMFID